MRYKKTVVWSNHNPGCLSQAINSGVEFAMISDDNQQCSPFCYCKDFIQDAFHGAVNNKKASIYGFCYNPSSPHQPSLGKTKLLVTNSSDKKFRDKIESCLDFLHQIERELGMSLTNIRECKDPPRQYKRSGVWYIEANKRWIRSAPMVSMFTLLVRLGFGHQQGKSYKETIQGIIDGKIKAYQQVDGGRLKGAWPGIKRIIRNNDNKIFCRRMSDNYPSQVTTSTVHNNMGIIGFAKGYTKTIMPRWHRKIEENP
jgi:hypothetical protein